jgi:hypothetical protein
VRWSGPLPALGTADNWAAFRDLSCRRFRISIKTSTPAGVSLARAPWATIQQGILMNLSAGCLHAECLTEVGSPSDEQVRLQIWGILAGLFPTGAVSERRFAQRFPYPNLIYLTPVGEDGISPAGTSVVVVGKHLSELGVGFYYQNQVLPHRRMIASLEMPDAHWAGFLMDITWCRFTRHGWYDSGGRFLQAVPSPLTSRVA